MKIKMISLMIAIILIIAMYVPVYAGTAIPDPPNGAYDYWVVTDSYGKTMLYTSPKPIRVIIEDGIKQIHLRGSTWYSLINGQWSYENNTIGNILATFNNIYAANHDIAYLDGSGVFFSPRRELCQVVREMEETGTFGAILRTFSAGLIPVLGCLILAISFRKGWAFLQGQLRH